MTVPRPRPTRVLLIGMMGAGKSTIGRSMAAATGWRYLDNDELVFQAVGVTTEELQRREGEEPLRAAESRALQRALELDSPVIAGVAAGVVTRSDDVDRLLAGDAFVVYLRAKLATLVSRVSGTHRPWLGDDPAVAMSRLYEGREPLYQRVASLVVDIDGKRPSRLARGILEELNRRQRGEQGVGKPG